MACVKRVLQLVFSLDVGGLEQVVVDLCNNLPAVNVLCYLGCLSHFGAKASQVSARSSWLGSPSISTRFIQPATLFSLCRFIKNNSVDVIHSHNPKAHLYGALASLFTGCPHIHTVHGRGSIKDSKKRKLLRRWLTKLTDFVVAVSEDVRVKLINDDLLPEIKIITIVNGVDAVQNCPVDSVEFRNELRVQRSIPVNKFVIGSVGRFAKEKNFPLLIDAFEMFQSKCPDSHLVIVGDGCRMENVKNSIHIKGLDVHCSLPGVQHDVSEWMKCFDLFTLSSLTEGTSVTLLEALATGVPVVATNVGGNRSVVNPPECGAVVVSGDAVGMCSAWLDLKVDVDKYGLAARAARQRAINEFSVHAMIERYNTLYVEVLSKREK